MKKGFTLVVKQCRDCETQFTATHFNTKLCDPCREKNRLYRQKEYKTAWRESKKAPIEDKTCLHCGEAFTPKTRHNVKYCCATCTKEAHKEKLRQETKRRQAKIPLRECRACEEMFKPPKDDPRHVTCSRECRNEWTKMLSKKETERRQRKITPRVCLTCSENFIPKIYDVGSKQMQKYCSKECLANYPMRKLSNNMSGQLRKALRYRKQKKNNKTFTILGYSKYQLKKHLESQFTDGMSWDNMSEWHIDHIRPVSSFKFTTEDCEDFKKCWALENLQPLWAADNISKGDKWDGEVNA